MRAIVYLRVSTHNQKEFGVSLQAQQKMCELEAKKQGITKKLIFTDTLSGTINMWDRPGLTDALLELNKGDVFIVSHRDRLARDTKTMCDIRLVIRNTPATLVIVADHAQETKSLLLQSTLADIIAEHEQKIIQTRTKNSVQSLKNKNRRVGTVPFGYQLSTDGKHIEPSDIEQKIINNVQRLRELNYTYTEITKELVAMNTNNRKGNPFGKTQLHRMLGGSKTNTVNRDIKKERQEFVTSLALKGLSISTITKEVNRSGLYTTKHGTPLLRTQISRILKQAKKEFDV